MQIYITLASAVIRGVLLNDIKMLLIMENLTISYLNIFEILIDTNSDIDITVEVIVNSNEEMTAENVEVFTRFLKKYFLTKFKDRFH